MNGITIFSQFTATVLIQGMPYILENYHSDASLWKLIPGDSAIGSFVAKIIYTGAKTATLRLRDNSFITGLPIGIIRNTPYCCGREIFIGKCYAFEGTVHFNPAHSSRIIRNVLNVVGPID
jgi:hypothetical protein